MKRLFKFLLGCAAGATVAVLATPKPGRAWRRQLFAAPRQRMRARGGEEWVPDEDASAWSPVDTATVAVDEQPAADEAATPTAVAATPPGDDLRSRIAETRAAIEDEIAQPFAAEAAAADREPAAAPELAAEVEPPAAPEPAAAPGPVAEAEPAIESEPVAEPEPAAESESATEAEPIAEVEPDSESEPVAAAELIAQEGAEAIPEDAGALAESASTSPPPPDAVASRDAEAPVPVPVAEPASLLRPVADPEGTAAVAALAAAPAAAAETTTTPAAREAGIDQVEMRRRIEETRARLKAKAFDAMMTGESALLARDQGDKPVPRDVEVDKEVATTIEESLSPEEF
ncbi:MAG: hypothetical protein ACLQUT_01675 [Thermoleophilia bacterium]